MMDDGDIQSRQAAAAAATYQVAKWSQPSGANSISISGSAARSHHDDCFARSLAGRRGSISGRQLAPKLN